MIEIGPNLAAVLSAATYPAALLCALVLHTLARDASSILNELTDLAKAIRGK